MSLLYTYITLVWLCILGAAFFMGWEWLKVMESGINILSDAAVGIAAVFGICKYGEWKKQQIAKDHRERAVNLYEMSFDFFRSLENSRVGLLDEFMYKKFMELTDDFNQFDRECRLAKSVIHTDEKLIRRIYTFFIIIKQKSFSIESCIKKSWNKSYWGNTAKLEIENEKVNIKDSEKEIIKTLSSSLSLDYFGIDEVGEELKRLEEDFFIMLEPYLNYNQQ